LFFNPEFSSLTIYVDISAAELYRAQDFGSDMLHCRTETLHIRAKQDNSRHVPLRVV